jgi:hypothetical protein
MAITLVWWTGIAFEAVILLRCSRNGLLKRYPLFFGYVACVLIKDLIGVATYHSYELYQSLYWPLEAVTILASCAIIFEIFRWSTRHKPGIRRLAQNALLIVFAITIAYAAVDFLHDHFVTASRAIANLGRDFRYVEAGILLVTLWLLARYRLALGRNSIGLMIGYSFYLALNIVNVALWFQDGNEFSVIIRGLLPATYVITLGIWCVALWSPYPEPVQSSETAIERDYEIVSAKTRQMLAIVFGRLFRIMKP